MSVIFLAVPILAASPFLQAFQDSDADGLRFHRVHLTNGNFIDGQLLKSTPNAVLLKVRLGEMTIRRDQIDRVEFIKMRDRLQVPIVDPKPPKKPIDRIPDLLPPDKNPPAEKTPAEIRRKVDGMIFVLKAKKGDEKEFPVQQLAPLGDEGIIYLLSKVPEFDLAMLDAAASAVITLKPSPAVMSVLEGLLSSENPKVRAMAVTVIGVSVPEADKLKFLRPALQDKDPRVRETVLGMLGSTEDRELFAVMSDLCSDSNRDVRGRALKIASNLAGKHGMTEALARLLMGNLSSGNEGIRSDSAAVLGTLGYKEAWPALANALNDPDASVRASASLALMNLAVPESGEAVLNAILREDDKWARIGLAGVVQKLKLGKAIETLINWMSVADADVKKVAETTLIHLTGENFGPDREKWSAWYDKNKPK